MESNWSLLTNKNIIDIFIGDVVIRDEVFEQYRMPYLRAYDIFDLAKEFDLELSYEVGPKLSRWKYMQLLIEHCIENEKINKLLLELISLKKFKEVLKDLNPQKIVSVHTDLVWSFIEKINSILVFDDYILDYNGKRFIVRNISEKSLKFEKDSIDYNEIVTNFCKTIKKDGLKTKYGSIKEIFETGKQGGNGRVLFGKLNNREVAIKVLYNNSKDKKNRFFEEFINVFMTLQKEIGIVELYLYDSVIVEEQEIHYILMKKYKENLLQAEKQLDKRNITKLIYSLCAIIDKIHKVNIVHRDIKPENILIDENEELILTDFGIAYFDPENYEYTGHTVAKDLLGNRKFSAPEQAEKDTVPHPTTDIYALGQILQWYITGKTHNGTGRKKVSTILDGNYASYLDIIIDKCIRQEPKERYQNINEIYNDLEKYGIILVDNTDEIIDLDRDFLKQDYEMKTNDLGLGDKIVII